MKKISTHIIVTEKSQNIAELLESISYEENEINIININSGGNIEIFKKYNAVIHSVAAKNISDIRNEFVEKSSCNWQLYFEPGDKLKSGWEYILDSIRIDNCYSFFILQDKFINKSIRLWNKKYKFINPVFEHIDCDTSKVVDVFIESNPEHLDKTSLVGQWLYEKPLSAAPHYYKSCNYLYEKKYQEFINSSEKYLFYEKKKNTSFIMTHYYRTMAFLILKEYAKAIDAIKVCLATKPEMAEFWCMLGNCFVACREYGKAIQFYEIAITEGTKRNIKDDFPIIPSMYKEYPLSKIQDCNEILLKTKKYSLS